MSYKINFTDTVANPQGITVRDQTLNNSDTDLIFVGKNFPGYSEFIGENFLHLLENFSRNIPPAKPVKGQLWYDTGTNTIPPKPQLKVFDGTNWTEAGNIKKGLARPAAENSIVGDLWVDSDNQQLYLFTGTTWVLVGPQFNESSNTGFRAEEIIDSATNTEKIVISFVIEEKRVLIISRYEFVPKIRIEGFNVIRQGLNLSSEDFNLNNASNKFWGVSEKSNALVVGNSTVAADNFLRSDAVSTTGFQFNIRTGAGLNIGPGLETSITSSSAGTVIHQTTPGANIILRTTQTQGSFNNLITATSDRKVGINKIPDEALDIEGNFLVSGSAKINDTTESATPLTGALTVSGGVGVIKNLNVGGNFEVSGNSVLNSIVPKTDNVYDIGAPGNRYKNVYASNVEATNFTGNFIGFVSGNVSGSAARLTNTVNFSLEGDVVAIPVPFNGTSGVALEAKIGPDIISSKPIVSDSLENDEFLVYRSTATPSLRKISKSTLFSNVGTVPIGSVFPYAGDTPPAGYLFCDGSEQSRSLYPELFSVLKFKFKAENELIGFQTFALPDLRGRFPAGREGMDNGNTINKQILAINVRRNPVFQNAISAEFVVDNENITNGPFQLGRSLSGTGLDTSTSAAIISAIRSNIPSAGKTTIIVSCQTQSSGLPEVTKLTIRSEGTADAGGGSPTPSRLPAASALGEIGGSSSVTLSTGQIPQHTHSLKDSNGNQYYAINSNIGIVPEPNVISGNIRFTSGEGHLLSNSGGVSTTSSLGQPVDITNPFLTMNYIIFTGRI